MHTDIYQVHTPGREHNITFCHYPDTKCEHETLNWPARPLILVFSGKVYKAITAIHTIDKNYTYLTG